MVDIEGSGNVRPLTSQKKEAYQAAYERGHNLFKKALKAYGTAGNNSPKKEKLKQVMDETLNVMQEAAHACLKGEKKKGIDQKKLIQDYQKYLENPSEGNGSKVMEDLENLKTF